MVRLVTLFLNIELRDRIYSRRIIDVVKCIIEIQLLVRVNEELTMYLEPLM